MNNNNNNIMNMNMNKMANFTFGWYSRNVSLLSREPIIIVKKNLRVILS